MAIEYELVDVWVGHFRSQRAFDAFFEETYGDDDSPLSPFAEAQGEHFYDHDFLERSFETAGAGLTKRMEGHSFAESFLAPALAAYEARGRPTFDAIVLTWNQQIEAPRDVKTAGVELVYLGRFPCRSD